MGKVTASQWNKTKRKTEAAMQQSQTNKFFSDAAEQTQDVSSLLNKHVDVDTVKELTAKKSEMNNLLSQAEQTRNYYVQSGNKKMVKSVDNITNYIKNLSSAIDNRRGVNGLENMFEDLKGNQTDYSDVLSSTATKQLKAQENQSDKIAENYSYNMYLKHKGKDFDTLTNDQFENQKSMDDSNRERLYKENQWIENYKESIATDDDYVKAVDTAKSKIEDLKKQKEEIGYVPGVDRAGSHKTKDNYKQRKEIDDEINRNEELIEQYQDYIKYGKSNMDKWDEEYGKMNYEDLKKYSNENSKSGNENTLKNKISASEGGKEYLASMENTEQEPTAEGYIRYRKNANIEDLTEKEEQALYDAEEKSKNAKLKTEYLNNYIQNYKSETTDYEDLKKIRSEYENGEVSNASGTFDIQEDWKQNYEDRYLRSKSDYNFSILPEEEQQEIIKHTRNKLINSGKDIKDASYSGDEAKDVRNRVIVSDTENSYFKNKKKELVKRGYTEAEADSILSAAERKVNTSIAIQEDQELKQYATNYGAAATFDSVPKSLASGVGAVSNIWNNLSRAFGSETPIDWNSSANRLGQNAMAEREYVKSGFKTQLGKFVYDAFTSTLDSAATLPLNAVVPGATMTILGSSAAQQSMLDAHNKGLSDSQAVVGGVVAGIFEGLFEELSLDKIVKTSGGTKSIKSFLVNTAKSMGIEGSEEVFTEIANICYDTICNGEYSDYKIAIKDYMSQGYSEKEAESNAKSDMAIRVAESGLGGMLGGAMFSIPLNALNYANNSAYRKMEKTGKTMISNDTHTELQEYIEDNYDEGSEMFKQMEDTDWNDAAQVGYLASTVAADEYTKAGLIYGINRQAAVMTELERLGVSENDSAAVSRVVINEDTEGAGISKELKQKIQSGEYKEAVEQVKSEMQTNDNGETAEWTQKFNSEASNLHRQNAENVEKLMKGERFATKTENVKVEKVNEQIEQKIEAGEVTQNGKSYLLSDDNAKFNIKSLSVGEDGTTQVHTDTNQSYNINDVAIDRDTAVIEEFGKEYDSEQREKFFRSYNEMAGKVSAEDFAQSFEKAYEYGKENLGVESALKNKRLNRVLTLDAIGRAYDAGKLEYNKELAKKQETVRKGSKSGTVRFDKVNRENLNETQNATVQMAEILSEVTGVNYEFFESSKDEQGDYIGENGSYNPDTNTIRIDINAGMKNSTEGSNIMVVTLSHELTHFIESFSPKQYAILEEFAFNKLAEETGKDIKELLYLEKERIKQTRESKGQTSLSDSKLESTARSELVAKSFESMLTDKNSIKELAKKNKNIFVKIKNKILDFAKKIETACKELFGKDGEFKEGTISKEARMLQKYAKEMREMWSIALEDAGENVRDESYNSSNTESLMMLRTDEYYEGIEPATREESMQLKMVDNRNIVRYRNEIDSVFDGSMSFGNKILVGMPSQILMDKGIPNKALYMSQSVAIKIAYPGGYKVGNKDMGGKHNLGISVLKNLIYQINDPMAITKNTDSHKNTDESFVLWTNWKTSENNSIIAAVRVNKEGEIVVDNNVVTVFDANSSYAKQFIEDKDKVLYTKNNKDINELLANRRHMPEAGVDDTLVKKNLTQGKEKVNNILNQDRNTTDSEGNNLTAEQQEYFKDSKVRDEDGNLMVMYHGTPTGGFTVFKNDIQFFSPDKNYADAYQNPSASSRQSGKESTKPQTYEVYLNITKPFDIRDAKTKNLFINEYVKGGWALGINPYVEYKDTTSTGLPSWEEADNIYEFLEENDLLDSYDGIVVDEGGIPQEDGSVKSRGIAYVTFNQNQIKNTENENPTENADIRYQDRKNITTSKEPFFKGFSKENDSLYTNEELYSYNHLVSMPDMVIVELGEYSKARLNGKILRDNIIRQGMDNAERIGIRLNDYSVAVQNDYTGRYITISNQSIKHSLDGKYNRLLTNARINIKAGEVVKRAIPINGLRNKSNLEGTYLMTTIVKDADNTAVAMITVEANTDNIINIAVSDNTHSISGRIKREVSGKGKTLRPLQNKNSSKQKKPDTSLRMTIADVLDIVKDTYSSALSQDVRLKLGIEENNGEYSNKTLFQDRDKTPSNREILATALKSAAVNETERRMIAEYQENIEKLNDLDKELEVVSGAIRDLSFASGPRNVETLKDLTKQAERIRREMKYHDGKLLKLESATSLKNLLEREKQAAAKKQRQADAKKLKAYRELQNERFDRQQKRYQDMAKRKVESRKRTEARNKVIKRVEKLNQILEKPTYKKNIPAPFMQATVNLLEGLNQDGMNVAERLADIEDRIAGYTGDTEGITKLFNTRDILSAKKAELEKRSQKLSEVYAAVQNDSDYSGYYSDTVMNQINQMKNIVQNKAIGAMNIQELDVVKETIDLLTNEIKKWNETLDTKFIDGNGNEMKIRDISTKGYTEVLNRPEIKDNLLHAWTNSQLSATRMFKKIGGYVKNGMWEQIGKMLDKGQIKALKFQQGASSIFDRVTSNTSDKENQKNLKQLQSYKSKNLVEIGLVDENGDSIEMTRGMMLSVYMHLENEENTRHAMYGGFTVPEIKGYYKGNRANAFAQGKRRVLGISTELVELGKQIQTAVDNGASNSEIMEIEKNNQEIIKRGELMMAEIKANIEEQLTDYDRKWIQSAKEYFDVYSKDAINEVTMMRYGIKKAGVKNYFPIHTDSNYLSAETSAKGENTAINLENSGFMQDRVKSTKPIFLEDIVEVVNSQIEKTSTYVGFLIPQYNYNRIMGYTADGYKTNMRDILDKKFGTQARQYLSNLEKDLFGGRAKNNSRLSKYMSKARGYVAQAALSLNISVTMGQAASYVTAAPVVGYDNLAKALAKGGKNGLVISAADRELINKYTPLLWYRNLGNSSQAVAEMKNGISLYNSVNDATNGYVLGWIQKMDVATVGRLWYASQYYVDEQFPELEKKSDPYYEKVAEIFNRVVEETQPNYTTMQRPDVLRGNDEILKSLTMFSTQRMQNFNIMYDAIATAHRYKIDFNNHVNGVTAEDVKQANKTRNAAITSQVASSVILGVMKTLAALLLLKWKNFGDDENKITKEGVAKQLLKENSNSFVGNFMFGSNLYEALEAIIFKDEFYGISLTGFDSITDFMESVVDYSQKAVHGELGFNSESGTDTLNLAKKFGTVFGAPVAQGYNLCNAISGWSQFAYAKITGENPSLSDYAQTVEIKQNNMVRKYLSDNDMDSINGLIDDKIKELKEKYPSYSDKKLKQKAQSSIRGSVTTVLKEEYLAADETEKKNIIEKMKNTGLYTKTSGKKTKDDSKDTAVEWEVSELKEQYLAAEDKETRKEIRKNLYATGKWKKLSELDKQLKKWLK